MLPVSVCIITKNEEQYIGTCLEKLSRYDWEIIVTDTGSTDRTVEIAKRYTPNVFHFPWINDFSAARNYCISKASRCWILNVDCDEYLTCSETPQEMKRRLSPCFQLPQQAGMIEIINPHASSINDTVSVEHIARFFHKDYYTYQGTVHEQPAPIAGGPVSYFSLPLSFYHAGYSDEAVLKKKAARNIQLLEQAILNNDKDPYLYYQLGQSHFVTGDARKACDAFEQGLSFEVDPNLQYVRTMVESYGYSLLQLKKYEQALQFEGIYETFCSHADFVFLMGLIYMNNAMFDEAIAQFLHATDIPDHSVDGVNSYLAYYNAGVIYECAGMAEEALGFYEKCGEYQPALEGMARLRKGNVT